MQFDPNTVHFPRRYETTQYDRRTEHPEQHAAQVGRLAKQTSEHVRKRWKTFILTRMLNQPNVDAAECNAMRTAFENREPYLSPKLTIPANTTVDSLLNSKHETLGDVHYGKVTVAKEHAATFERLQRELAGIDQEIATRQLYQAMHGSADMRVHFSEHGISAALLQPTGGKLIYINTRMSFVDPLHGSTLPLSIIMGHEIEHANLPLPLSHSLISEKDKDFTNLEEVRVIDGYEAAMLKALGHHQRSTHVSHVLPIDAEGRPGIPYRNGDTEEHLRPGQSLSGKMLEATSEFISLQTADGRRIQVSTPMLMLANFGLEHVQRLGFESPLSALEKLQDKQLVAKRTREGKPSASALKSANEEVPFNMERAFMAHPEVAEQFSRWQTAVSHGDTLMISLNAANLVQLQRTSKDPNPIGTMLAKRKKLQDGNTRNRAIGIAVLGGGAVLAGVTTYAIVANMPAKRHKVN